MTFDARDKALELLESLEPVAELPEGVTERIQQLRNQIKRLGAINYEAQNEFDELDTARQIYDRADQRSGGGQPELAASYC